MTYLPFEPALSFGEAIDNHSMSGWCCVGPVLAVLQNELIVVLEV